MLQEKSVDCASLAPTPNTRPVRPHPHTPTHISIQKGTRDRLRFNGSESVRRCAAAYDFAMRPPAPRKSLHSAPLGLTQSHVLSNVGLRFSGPALLAQPFAIGPS
jgi:hypothetical protein